MVKQNKNVKISLCVTVDLEDRTNNICEGFNNYLSHIIEIYKPRISYFTDKIEIITKKFFKLYKCFAKTIHLTLITLVVICHHLIIKKIFIQIFIIFYINFI